MPGRDTLKSVSRRCLLVWTPVRCEEAASIPDLRTCSGAREIKQTVAVSVDCRRRETLQSLEGS